jgi:hypothetical protein
VLVKNPWRTLISKNSTSVGAQLGNFQILRCPVHFEWLPGFQIAIVKIVNVLPIIVWALICTIFILVAKAVHQGAWVMWACDGISPGGKRFLGTTFRRADTNYNRNVLSTRLRESQVTHSEDLRVSWSVLQDSVKMTPPSGKARNHTGNLVINYSMSLSM